MTNAQPPLNIPDAPTAEVQALRSEFPNIDINVELNGTLWAFVARGKNGGNAWFIASDSIERFRRALTGKGFHE